MGFVSAYETAAGRRYRVRYRKPDHSEGQKRGFKTKRDAELFLSTVEIGKATGQFIDPGASRVLVSELGQQWLRTRVNLKPSSLKPVQSSWRVYVEPKWGGWPIGSISHSPQFLSSRRKPGSISPVFDPLNDGSRRSPG